MRSRCIATAVAVLVTSLSARAADRADLGGTWVLDAALSDDIVTVIRDGGRRGDGFGREVARSSGGVIGIPGGSLPPRAGGSPTEQFPSAGPVVAVVRRLVIEVSAEAVALDYGNAGRLTYRPEALERAAGASHVAHWREGGFEIEHELSNGARIVERYEYVARTAELHWTARFDPPQGAGFDVRRVFYRSRAR